MDIADSENIHDRALEKVIEEREQLLRLLNRPPDWTLDRSNCQQKSGYNSSSEGGPSAKTCLEEPSGDILRPMPSSSSPNMPIFELYGAVLDPVDAWELIEQSVESRSSLITQ